MKLNFFQIFSILCTCTSFGQFEKDSLKINFYSEMYFVNDFNNKSSTFPGFYYNHNKTNEVNLNLALVEFKYNTHNFRANFDIMAGTYANENLSNEDQWAQFINEANVGVKLSKTKELWLDVGILPSHIGFESNKGADCFTLSRSIIAENSPYFETGINLNYTSKNKKLYTALLVLNGWQNIATDSVNKFPAIGTQINYAFTPKVTINYSNFFGNNPTITTKELFTFHNFYTNIEIGKDLKFNGGFDFGTTKASLFYGYSLQFQKKWTGKFYNALRVEKYKDLDGIFIVSSPNIFNISGYSLNVDYHQSDNIIYRIETKYLDNQKNNKNTIFLFVSLVFKI